jgi:hypothetical protein
LPSLERINKPTRIIHHTRHCEAPSEKPPEARSLDEILRLDCAQAGNAALDKTAMNEATFARMHAANRMARKKQAEDIAGLSRVMETPERLLVACPREIGA